MSAKGVSKLNATNSSVELAAQAAVNANWMRDSSRAQGKSNILGSPPTLASLNPMQQVTVRPAVVSEQKALEALQWRASLNNPDDREALLANPDAIELPLRQIESGGVFVAEVAGSVVGFATILPREDGDSELDGLFVEPRAWRQGIGRVLVDHCFNAARSAGATSIHVVGNPHAESFYSACGFKAAGTQRMRFGVGLLLKRKLS